MAKDITIKQATEALQFAKDNPDIRTRDLYEAYQQMLTFNGVNDAAIAFNNDPENKRRLNVSDSKRQTAKQIMRAINKNDKSLSTGNRKFVEENPELFPYLKRGPDGEIESPNTRAKRFYEGSRFNPRVQRNTEGLPTAINAQDDYLRQFEKSSSPILDPKVTPQELDFNRVGSNSTPMPVDNRPETGASQQANNTLPEIYDAVNNARKNLASNIGGFIFDTLNPDSSTIITDTPKRAKDGSLYYDLPPDVTRRSPTGMTRIGVSDYINPSTAGPQPAAATGNTGAAQYTPQMDSFRGIPDYVPAEVAGANSVVPPPATSLPAQTSQVVQGAQGAPVNSGARPNLASAYAGALAQIGAPSAGPRSYAPANPVNAPVVTPAPLSLMQRFQNAQPADRISDRKMFRGGF